MCKQKIKRMANPDDTLVKRQVVNTGDVIHEFHGLPGEYLESLANEYPNAEGGTPRVDGAYLIKLFGKEFVVDFEDESTPIDEDALEKINRYRRNLEYFYQKGVISLIRTSLSKENCLKKFESSPTLCLHPWIVSLQDYGGAKRLSKITAKIKSNDSLTDVEAMNIVMIPKMFDENQDEILEKVCELFSRLKVEDSYYKCELALQMRCVIHKYAKTIDDIERLEG